MDDPHLAFVYSCAVWWNCIEAPGADYAIPSDVAIIDAEMGGKEFGMTEVAPVDESINVGYLKVGTTDGAISPGKEVMEQCGGLMAFGSVDTDVEDATLQI